MNIISSDVEIDEYKFLGIKSTKLVNALKQLDITRLLGFSKQLKEKCKTKCAIIHEECLKYFELHKKELGNTMIEKVKDGLTEEAGEVVKKKMKELKAKMIDKLK